MKEFETFDDEAKHNVVRAVIAYKTNMLTSLVKAYTCDVEFVIDAPETFNFFYSNLKYLGFEHTPLSHVDQVLRSLVVSYGNKRAQGIFKHKWMMYMMKPFMLLSAIGHLVIE